ncbi:MAG: extracellular solute-binding protein, partial [Geminicoccaceae bacterium]|nr:extracellular solute-binding protein [Geminicoccaceae bacterium]
MARINRRRLLQGTAVLSASAAFAGPTLLERARAWAQDMPFQPEEGATLRMLRWSRFVESEAQAFNELLDAFTQATGVQVQLDSEFFEDLRPKAAVAANVGDGPDIIWGIHADAHLYPDAMLDITDVAEHLGSKYGGWYDSAQYYGVRDGKWITLPFVFSGNLINYRQSMVQAAGFEQFPDNTDDMLKLAQKLKENGTPMGFALGNASGDGNAWTHWLIWSHGGKMVDENNNVVINSPETVEALKYGKALAENFVAGAGSWLDGNNNKAFLGGDISVTNNGISIYAAANAEGMTEIADDMQHAAYPVGPVGERTEL